MTNHTEKAACKCGGKCDQSAQGCTCSSKKSVSSPKAPVGSQPPTANTPASKPVNIGDKKAGCGCDK